MHYMNYELLSWTVTAHDNSPAIVMGYYSRFRTDWNTKEMELEIWIRQLYRNKSEGKKWAQLKSERKFVRNGKRAF